MGCDASIETAPEPTGQPPMQSSPARPAQRSSLFDIKELGQANQLFLFERYAEAAPIYRQFIGDHIEQLNQTDGLGQQQMSLGYYQWHPSIWYREGIEKGRFIGTPFDALALCQQALKNDSESTSVGTKWYRQMVDNYPQNYAIVIGYAHILNNQGFYEEAIDYYNQVQELNIDWIRPLQCMAYIYQYKRIQKSKAKQVANKILEKEYNNRVAMFVLARNQKDIDKKIEKLVKVTQLHPQYGRAFNEVGIVYGGTKKEYKQAIKWYTKATEVTPDYASCYNNIGVNYQLLKDYDNAIYWYFKGIEKDKEYKAPHANLIDVYSTLQYQQHQILGHMQKYSIYPDYYYYYTGLAHHDKKNYKLSIDYFTKAQGCAQQLSKHIYKLYNSIGITYDDMKQRDKALEYYKKCIEVNPKYHSAYYNTAIIYKNNNQIQQAIEWYKKAITINPRYSYAYNNLGNIYKNKGNNEQAIKNYKKAIQNLSTYTLALANLGVCYMKISNYREAFNAFERARQCLPTDNNNLSSSNKTFLKEHLEKFEKEGENWRQNGSISPQEKNKLKNLIKSFQANFKGLYSNQDKDPVSVEKVLKAQVLEVVRLVKEDQFELTNIDRIFALVKKLFVQNQDYFHIIPQLFMQYFYKNAFIKKRPILDIEHELFAITKQLSATTAEAIKTDAENQRDRKVTMKLNNCNPSQDSKVNLFKGKFFQSYEQIYSEIISVNKRTKESWNDFKDVVEYARKSSHGILYGLGTKIPTAQDRQFIVILRIFEKMFKKELTKERVEKMIQTIDEILKAKQNQNQHVRIADVVHQIMTTWTRQITQIVQDRKAQKIQTKCEVSDLLRAKIMYNSADLIKKAVHAVDQMCHRREYKILEIDDRLQKKATQDVVLKIKIKEAVCELQLAIEQDETQYHFTHSIYEIERSPLGCIFGSYIFMSKGFQYPFLENCRDILQHLQKSKHQQDITTVLAAKYIVQNLSQDPK